MSGLLRNLTLAIVGLVLVAATVTSAEAGKRYRSNNGANFAAGIATGLILGGIVSQNRRPRYYECYNGYCNGRYNRRPAYYPNSVHPRYYRRPPPVYYAPRPRRYYAPAPRIQAGWTRAHYAWCDARYRSYRAYDNTFQPYHGRRKQCRSPY
ncbi:MAG: BA14K family protein [Rhizobiaceae bacterium]|nr:BA14K family protein [Rhizobiaceae bacterium]